MACHYLRTGTKLHDVTEWPEKWNRFILLTFPASLYFRSNPQCIQKTIIYWALCFQVKFRLMLQSQHPKNDSPTCNTELPCHGFLFAASNSVTLGDCSSRQVLARGYRSNQQEVRSHLAWSRLRNQICCPWTGMQVSKNLRFFSHVFATSGIYKYTHTIILHIQHMYIRYINNCFTDIDCSLVLYRYATPSV